MGLGKEEMTVEVIKKNSRGELKEKGNGKGSGKGKEREGKGKWTGKEKVKEKGKGKGKGTGKGKDEWERGSKGGSDNQKKRRGNGASK